LALEFFGYFLFQDKKYRFASFKRRMMKLKASRKDSAKFASLNFAEGITNSPFSRIKRTSNCFFMQEVYIVAESRESGQEKIQQSVD
jgi:hypothetical protein